VAIEIAGIAKDRPKMAFDAWNDALSSSVVPRLLFHANLCCTTVLFDGIGTSLS
jgi:hypothetical protein